MKRQRTSESGHVCDFLAVGHRGLVCRLCIAPRANRSRCHQAERRVAPRPMPALRRRLASLRCPYPGRRALAAIRLWPLDASSLLMTWQRRDATEQVERLDKGSDQRQALHQVIRLCFNNNMYAVCILITCVSSQAKAFRRGESASDRARAIVSLWEGKIAHQSQAPLPMAATASTIRVKLARARPTVCRALR